MQSKSDPGKRARPSPAFAFSKGMISFISSNNFQRAITESLLPISNAIASLYEINKLYSIRLSLPLVNCLKSRN